jgi:hypothetical protein
MSFNIDDRLTRLKSRRMDVMNDSLKNRGYVEAFENRANNKATKYALGAMEEVDSRSTEISIEEAQKVEKALSERLIKYGLSPNFRLQGSVPLNVHIRGVSDVDLLALHGNFFTYAIHGPSANNYGSTGPGVSVVKEVLSMRRHSESELSSHFWGATVDKSNAKSIQLSEGGFRRKVDVVPSNWFDSIDYQRHKSEIYRGVTVVDKFTTQTTDNFPFLFAHHISQKAVLTSEGARMAIRLLKNVKSDMDEDISLSSYDIASLIFHCPDNLIQRYVARDMAILAGTQRWINELTNDRTRSEALMTPDGTRHIIDKAEKWNGLGILSKNLTELAREVDNELAGPYLWGDRNLDDIRKHLNESQIPLVPTY